MLIFIVYIIDIGNEDLTLPEQCEMTCVKCSLDLKLTVQQWSEVLCYLGKAKHLEDLTLKLSCSSLAYRVELAIFRREEKLVRKLY